MKDLIVKTALITLASIFAVFLIVFGALSMFSPLTLAKVFDGTGGYSSSIHFYEKHYKKTGDIEDLAILALKINQDIDAPLAEQYLEELINHEEFYEFCAKDGKPLASEEFYKSEYAVALVKNGKFDRALVVADKFVGKNGYTQFNPYSILLVEEGQNFSEEQLDKIKADIQKHSSISAGKAQSDIDYIERLKQENKNIK